MKKRLHRLICRGLPTLLLLFTITNTIHAQVSLGNEKLRIEAGISLGPTFFLGDLGGHRGIGTTFIKDINYPVTKFMKGLFLSVSPNEWLGFRIGAQLTYLEGADHLIPTNGTDETFRKDRNLDFKTHVSEAYGAIEFFPLMFLNRDDEDYQPKLRPYIFGGVGIFHFNPMGSLTDSYGNVTWHYLQPLHTEGEGFAEYPDRPNYKLTQINIPMGGGLKYFLSDDVNIGMELLYRKTFTDYIDDVSTNYINHDLFNKYLSPADANIAIQINDKSFTSGITRTDPGEQRGNPKNYDAYFSFALKLGFRLSGGNDNMDATKRTRCPSRF